jgi:WD40 repeat protein
MEGHHHAIQSIVFSPDGKQITSHSQDKNVKISGLSAAEPKHNLQYPTHLFPLPASPFQMDDGWILGSSDELILWVPAVYHGCLEHPHCCIMGNPNNTRIDFKHFKCGKEWTQCQELLK